MATGSCVPPQSVVYHVGGATLHAESPRKTFLNFRNNLLMIYKNLPEKELAPGDALAVLARLHRGGQIPNERSSGQCQSGVRCTARPTSNYCPVITPVREEYLRITTCSTQPERIRQSILVLFLPEGYQVLLSDSSCIVQPQAFGMMNCHKVLF